MKNKENKICILGDTHFGCRNDSIFFLANQKLFFEKLFFPTLKERGIKTVIHLGDFFDKARTINLNTFSKVRSMFMEKILSDKIQTYVLVGNHDIYYKNSVEFNIFRELYASSEWDNSLAEYIEVVDTPRLTEIGGKKMALIPWLVNQKLESFAAKAKDIKTDYMFGHFDTKGCLMYKGVINKDKGLEQSVFRNIPRVYSGHYHEPSKTGNIIYPGAPYEIIWSDYKRPRGFTILDLNSGEEEFIQNSYSIFRRIKYDDRAKSSIEQIYKIDETLNGCYVQVMVDNKENQSLFNKFIKSLEEDVQLSDLAIIDNKFYSEDGDDGEPVVEDGMSMEDILSNYIKKAPFDDVNKEELNTMMQSIFRQASQLI